MRYLIWAALLVTPLAANDLEQRATTIIGKRCLGCHNDQLKTAGLALTNRDAALRALTPGDSLLVRRVAAGEMPPGNPLSDEDRQTLREWIDAGAPWTAKIESERKRADLDWWSLQPLADMEPSEFEGLPEDWSHSAIDKFIYAKLREKGLDPSPRADRRTLIRRVSFDLTGLPPTLEEIEQFVNDQREDAYEKLVDRLLASPHYGERWGRHWLDVVRFGESNGYEQNHLRKNAWPYRDYVIRSLNEDKPFDQMVIEQLAGDVVGAGDPDVEVATGFIVAGVHDTVKIQNIEGEMQKRANDLDDMLSTTGAAFLGLTVNCARCHDHKFDPIQQTDYYRLQAVFAGVRHGERPLATAEEIAQRREKAQPIEEELKKIQKQMDATRKHSKPLVEDKREEIERGYRPPVDSRGTEETFLSVEARFVRMRILATIKNSTPAIDEFEIWNNDGRNVALAAGGSKATASSTRSTMTDAMPYGVENIIDGKFDKRWIAGKPRQAAITVELPRVETINRITWSQDRLGGFEGRFLRQVATEYVLEVSLDGDRWKRVADSKGRLPAEKEKRDELLMLAVISDPEREQWRHWKAQQDELRSVLAKLPKIPQAYIGTFEQPKEPSYLMKRGNPMAKGDVMSPGGMSTLERLLPPFELEPNSPEGTRRAALARWINDERNALTARVFANRIWHYHFGTGLVGTPSDFGFNGEKPTHPELLDWLSARVRELGWSWKAMHREILLSATYRQSSQGRPEALEVDADTRYLWRYPPRRLEAEAIRDSILAVSGKLNRKMGGPGFRLYQYTVDNVATYLPREKFGPETYRRSVYHQAARSVRDDVLGTHDCPDSTLPQPKRVITTTPLQALSLLNNPFLLDQAHAFAERLETEIPSGDTAARVERAYQLAFGRPPAADESTAAVTLVSQHGLVAFCRALLNANEFVYVM